MESEDRQIEQKKPKRRYTIGMKKAKQYPHFITLYKEDWSNEDAWNDLLKELNLPDGTPKVGLLLSKGGAVNTE